MRVHVRQKPMGSFNGVALEQYQQGRTYNMDVALGEFLIAQGYAVVEMRQFKRSNRRRERERRASPGTAVYIPEL